MRFSSTSPRQCTAAQGEAEPWTRMEYTALIADQQNSLLEPAVTAFLVPLATAVGIIEGFCDGSGTSVGRDPKKFTSYTVVNAKNERYRGGGKYLI